MRSKVAIVVAFFSLVPPSLWAQDLLRPGYWQQQVDYKIQVELDDVEHFLHANEDLVYTNNSPDTLTYIPFHLWPNAYSSKRTALAKQLLRTGSTRLAFATAEEMGYIDSLAFTIDGKPALWEYDVEHVDICTLSLEKPLLPGTSITIATPFRVKLPSGSISRLGHLGQSYQITQWYPKPAVYDHKGWHAMPYLNQGEFYSEFGSFDVEITLPSNYTIGATGDLQTQEELSRLDSLAEQTLKQISDEDDLSNAFPTSSSEMKTLRYVQTNVHDFAWFADKRFRVLKGEAELPHSERSVTVWTMFTPSNTKTWKNSIEYMHDAVYYYSLWNGDYPYKQATAIDGTISAGGGMEYPNVTVIGTSQTPYLLETVIMHEVGHNWFYGILGSNERDHPWMDEGLNSYNEARYLNTKYPDAYMMLGNNKAKIIERTGLQHYRPGDIHYLTYLISARFNKDQAHSVQSENYSSLNYGAIVYAKSAVIFQYLQAYLGDERMDEVMQAYFDTYKFKHPYPEDFRSVAEQVSGEDLSWLFDQILATTEKLDYKIASVSEQDQQTSVKLKNLGGVNGPVPLSLLEVGSVKEQVWIPPFNKDTTLFFNGRFDEVEIDANWVVPEVNRKNNYWRSKGLFGKYEPLEASLLGKIEDPHNSQFHYLPVVGANYPSGIMPGFAIYNSLLPVKRLNYVLAPMLSTKTFSLMGTGHAYYMFTPVASSFESIEPGVKAKRFVEELRFSSPSIAYNRLQPYIRFNFRPPNASGFFNHELQLSAVLVNSDTLGVADADLGLEQFYRMNYSAKWEHPIYNSTLDFNNEFHEQFFKTSLTLVNSTNLSDKLVARSRVFVGYFLNNASNDPRFNWRMDGQYGLYDYAYDANLLDRSLTDEAVFARQMTETYGAFKVPTAVAQSANGILAYNLTLKPNKIPLGLFADAGMNFGGTSVYDAGLYLSIAKGLLNVYAPLVWSDNIEQERLVNARSWTDMVRFEMRLSTLDIVELRKQLSF